MKDCMHLKTISEFGEKQEYFTDRGQEIASIKRKTIETYCIDCGLLLKQVPVRYE
jgi:hypothetical protein